MVTFYLRWRETHSPTSLSLPFQIVMIQGTIKLSSIYQKSNLIAAATTHPSWEDCWLSSPLEVLVGGGSHYELIGWELLAAQLVWQSEGTIFSGHHTQPFRAWGSNKGTANAWSWQHIINSHKIFVLFTQNERKSCRGKGKKSWDKWNSGKFEEKTKRNARKQEIHLQAIE